VSWFVFHLKNVIYQNLKIGDLQERLEGFGPVRLEWPNMDHMPMHRNSSNSKENVDFR
jgi:hypothetical protein